MYINKPKPKMTKMSSAHLKSEPPRGGSNKASPFPGPATHADSTLSSKLLQTMMDSLKADIQRK